MKKPETMKALVLVAPKTLEYKDVEVPSFGEEELLIEVKSCTLCNRSDMRIYNGRRGRSYPRMFGHEVAGLAVRCGNQVNHINPGDRVLLRMTKTGFAEYGTAHKSQVVRLPPEIDFAEGAIGQLMPVAVRGIEKGVNPQDTVFISGAGPAGMLCLQVARAYGAERIIVADLYQERLNLAKKTGATDLIQVKNGEVGEQVQDLTGGGADVSIECAGVEASFRSCEKSLKPGGTIVVFGTHLDPIEIDLAWWEGRSYAMLIAREQKHEARYLLQKTVDLVGEGNVDLKPLLTHTFPLAEGEKAFQLLKEEPEKVCKIALIP